jgi:hypothetical protein
MRRSCSAAARCKSATRSTGRFSSILNFTGPARESAVPHAPIRQHKQAQPRCAQAAEQGSFGGSLPARSPQPDYRESQ